MKEFDIIAKYFAPSTINRDDVILGIGDDCALLKPPLDKELAVATDSLVAGIHFSKDAAAYDIGYKALAVNLSDLAAMGATPAWATLALTLPTSDETWLAEFCRGFFDLCDQYSIQLIGGDTTCGPLTINVQVYGFVPPNQALRRSGAKTGDLIYVTGTLGDAGLALYQTSEFLSHRLNRPTARIVAGTALRDIASAAIDISDGLAADLNHILQQSKVGATIYAANLPLSKELKQKTTIQQAQQLALGAGDDYELCFTVPAAKKQQLTCITDKISCNITQIGIIEAQLGLRIKDDAGKLIQLERNGYEHF